MAQAGMHALVGAAFKNLGVVKQSSRGWLITGILIGSIFPDLDNLAVAVATLTKSSTEGLHRTATHSLVTTAAVMAVFWLIGQIRHDSNYLTFGLGFGTGILLHIGLDLLIWFNGVALFWPVPVWVDLWANANIPDWFFNLMEGFELLFYGLFFAWLARQTRLAGAKDTTLRMWMAAALILWVIFTPLLILQTKGLTYTLYGAVYLIFLVSTVVLVFRSRNVLA